VDLYSAYRLKTSNALVTLAKAKRIVLRNCLKLSKLRAGSLSSSGNEFQTVGPAITAVGAESTARNDELVSVGGAQTKTRSEFGGWNDMITVSEFARDLTYRRQHLLWHEANHNNRFH